MTHPLMLDLIAKERRRIRQEIAEEYSQAELEALAKRSRIPVKEFLECASNKTVRMSVSPLSQVYANLPQP